MGAAIVAAGTWVVDLDGVMWLAEQPIAGSAQAVDLLRAAGVRVLFATNNADPTRAQLVTRLAAVGVEAAPGDLVTSAEAAATMVSPGATVLACGGDGLREALTARGCRIVEEGRADAVIVGLTPAFDYDMLTRAAMAVRGGARLIGTNEDPTHPTPRGLLPGSGALLAAVATAAQVRPEVAGKPHPPMVALLAQRAPDVTVVVGDRPATDGELAARLHVPFALVHSGVTAPGHGPVREAVAVEMRDLGALVAAVVGPGAAEG